ncbi:hypothetical protein B0J13DRAFT_162712 [Dactylonectria estremocensis]|uniref:Histidine kinase n=1 Tax=Dactylonectria estremocensis TaxID=1079267 RepID=A0A9P9DJZ7_9HYPO|nr:hypothetical protein B0J13DRAFT_162712 [Dactylonectria estremocensis]
MAATSRPRQAVSHKIVSESVREREMFRHWPPFQNAQGLNDFRQSPADGDRLSSADVILTALTQLGIYQLGAQRTFVSLFDSEYQYFIAEATSGTYLRPSIPNHEYNQPFRLCGTAARRRGGACEYTLLNHPSDDPEDRDGERHHADDGQLPVTVVPDLVADSKFSMQTLPTLEPTCARFYAAVPIRTKRGINIGVYCITNTSTRQWTELNADRMRDISSAISDHLEAESLKAANRRNTRMNRGLGSFLEGSTTLSGWQLGPNPIDFADVAGSLEGNLNSVQQSLQRDGDEVARNTSPDALIKIGALPKHYNHTHRDGSLSRAKDTMDTISENNALENVFSRAANIIRESVEVEGCVFLDMTMASYRAHQTRARTSDAGSVGLSSSTSSDENTHRRAEVQHDPMCDVKGISTSASSSIDRVRDLEASVCLPEKFMRRMSRRYPKGKIFNFSIDGELQTSDSSCNEQTNRGPCLTDVASPVRQEARPAPRTAVQTRPLSRQREGKAISAAFPGARSVAFFPVWDSRLEKWCASGLIYTNAPSRAFTVEGELSYLRAFGMLAATEIVRLEALQADKAKSDALGSLSHELRSPLHGVLLSTELMADTKLDVFQSNIAHTIETCSRTLLDTIDHLLDYSKVNSFADSNKYSIGQAHSHQRAFASEGFGKKSLVSDYLLDDLVEDVVESVFAGFNFQRKSINQHVSRQQRKEPRPSSSYADNAANSASDYLEAMEQLGPQMLGNKKSHLTSGNVTVVLSLDAGCDWLFRFQVGALRRIVMNIVGNALKYTSYGTITVSLTQQVASIRRRKPQQVIKFTVEDTGKGINEEFLQRGIFKPFSQEDGMSPGTGLGLNLVKQIVSQLRGQISIDSQVGIGTVVSILLPLERPKEPKTVSKLPDAQATFQDQIRDLAGLRVRLMSRPTNGSIANLGWRKALECACLEWLMLEVLAEDEFSRQPDVVLWTYDTLPSAPEDIASLAQTPNVVICPDAVAAYEQTRAFETAGWRGVFEFISQPVGPRKLAKTLSLAYSRWTTNEGSAPTLSSPSAIRLSVPNQNEGSLRDGSSDINRAASESLLRRSSPIETGNCLPSCLSVKIPVDAFLNNEMAVDSKSDVSETPKKFLLVDDNHINLKILAAYMKKMQLTYHTATNGKEAVDQYTQSPHSYACILLDISMPVMDGFEAARRIRGFEDQESVEKAVPIFALSGLASEEAQREAYGSGIDLFLLKPVKLQVLGETLREKGILDSLGK